MRSKGKNEEKRKKDIVMNGEKEDERYTQIERPCRSCMVHHDSNQIRALLVETVVVDLQIDISFTTNVIFVD